MRGDRSDARACAGHAKPGQNRRRTPPLGNETRQARRPPTAGAFLLASVPYFYSGQPLQNLSGVDRIVDDDQIGASSGKRSAN
jgi:hypothetical protein